MTYATAMAVLKLRGYGFKVDEMNGLVHLRVNDRLDYFPKSGKWHDTKTNTRGQNKGNARQFVWDFFKTAADFKKAMA